MKHKTGDVATEQFVRLKPRIYLFLVNDNSEHKKAKSVNKNVFAAISNNGYKNVLLNKKFLRDSMNRIQSKDHRTGAYKIKKNHSLALMTKCISKSMD